MEHGIVTLGQLQVKVLEVQNLFDNAMNKMISEATSLGKNLQLQELDKEMDLRIEKLARNLKQMKNYEAIDQETEKYMKIVEGDHAYDLPSEYMR